MHWERMGQQYNIEKYCRVEQSKYYILLGQSDRRCLLLLVILDSVLIKSGFRSIKKHDLLIIGVSMALETSKREHLA